jgi:sugar porter (SP) family MFS transporter
MLGGLGVGAALIIAPMYIAEVSAARVRGRMVSVNQLNIVIGISAAFFSNYLILKLGQSGLEAAGSAAVAVSPWRWMLGVEVIPALLFLLALFAVPESPRWLMMHGDQSAARRLMLRAGGASQGEADFELLKESLQHEQARGTPKISELFSPAMRLVLTIGLIVSVLQQLTGINAVFFYAPMIFEKSGIGTDASFMQAVLVGLVNLVFTVLAIAFVDRLGRRPLLIFGLAGIALSMAVLAYGFSGGADEINPLLVLIGTLAFVASFAISIGPVMWVLFAELFPNRLRGLAVSLVGLVNSAVSFLVQLVFPWELENFGSSVTFIIYGAFATVGLLLVWRLFPETKGRSLEEIERELVAARPAGARP